MLKQLRDLRARRAEGDNGFTLIELLIVVVVLGILAGIVVFGVSTFKKDSTDAACNATVKSIQVAEEAYYAKNATYTDLATLQTAPAYLKTFTASGYAIVMTPANGTTTSTTYSIAGTINGGGGNCSVLTLTN